MDADGLSTVGCVDWMQCYAVALSRSDLMGRNGKVLGVWLACGERMRMQGYMTIGHLPYWAIETGPSEQSHLLIPNVSILFKLLRSLDANWYYFLQQL